MDSASFVLQRSDPDRVLPSLANDRCFAVVQIPFCILASTEAVPEYTFGKCCYGTTNSPGQSGQEFLIIEKVSSE